MSRRNRQLVGIIVIALAFAAFAWGCGSSDNSSDTTTTSGSSTPDVTTAHRSTKTTDSLIDAKIATTSDTPKDYKDAVEQKRPIVMLFYVPGQADDSKVLASLQALAPSFANYTFLLYNYKNPTSYGNLSTLLGITYPPEIVLVRADGTVKKVLNGYQDQGSLNQQLVNLGTGS